VAHYGESENEWHYYYRWKIEMNWNCRPDWNDPTALIDSHPLQDDEISHRLHHRHHV
jgi:hypothetical protein